MPAKELLREKLKAQRLLMSQPEVDSASRLIAKNLITTVDWPVIKRLHIYKSHAAWNEVMTGPIAEELIAKFPHLEITQPSKDKYQALPVQKFDLIIVPVLAFDKHNHRLGLGGGFYDRFLSQQAQALKIGVAYSWAYLKDSLPHEPHDIKLDRIITESGTRGRIRTADPLFRRQML
jgi:5-formyltetrahydrofolate cyclo-ligase